MAAGSPAPAIGYLRTARSTTHLYQALSGSQTLPRRDVSRGSTVRLCALGPETTSESLVRYGWTTGACATAAATAAYTALLTGEFPDAVEVLLPKGKRPSFALA